MSWLVTPTGTKGLPPGIKRLGLLSRVEPPTGIKRGPFVRVGGSTRDKKPLSPMLARLAVGPRTKTTFYPGPKGNRDKWSGTKCLFCSSEGGRGAGGGGRRRRRCGLQAIWVSAELDSRGRTHGPRHRTHPMWAPRAPN